MAYKNDSSPYTTSQYVLLNDTEDRGTYVDLVMYHLLMLLYLISGNNQTIL